MLERTRKGKLGEREELKKGEMEVREGCVCLSNLLPKRLQLLQTSRELEKVLHTWSWSETSH